MIILLNKSLAKTSRESNDVTVVPTSNCQPFKKGTHSANLQQQERLL